MRLRRHSDRGSAVATIRSSMTGHIRVMSANALNLFSTVDAGDNRCGPDADACRGADSLAAEFERQLAKLVTTIRLSGADVVALMEVENDTGETLGRRWRAAVAGGDRRFVARALIPAWWERGPIKVGLIYNSDARAVRKASRESSMPASTRASTMTRIARQLLRHSRRSTSVANRRRHGHSQPLQIQGIEL